MIGIKEEVHEKIDLLFKMIDDLVEGSNDKEKLMVPIALLLRIQASIKSCTLLTEAKLIHEAEAALRLALETLVWLFSFYKLEAEDFEKRRKVNFLINKVKGLKLIQKYKTYTDGASFDSTEDDIAKLNNEINTLCPKNEKGNRIKIEENFIMAEECGLGNLRGKYFPLLCQSSHLTMHKLGDYVVKDGQSVSFKAFPYTKHDVDWISEILHNITLLIISLINEEHDCRMQLKSTEEFLKDF